MYIDTNELLNTVGKLLITTILLFFWNGAPTSLLRHPRVAKLVAFLPVFAMIAGTYIMASFLFDFIANLVGALWYN